MHRYLPLAAALALVAAVLASERSPRLDALATRIAGAALADDRDAVPENRETLVAAQIPSLPRLYVARTRLYAVALGAAGAVIGVYAGDLVGGVVAPGVARTAVDAVVSPLWPAALPEGRLAQPIERFVALSAGSVLVAALAVGATYAVRRYGPRVRAERRRRRIEAGLPRTVAFAYALSRGGISFPDVLRTLARNDDVFGEGATEIRTAVREVDLVGRDIVATLRRVADRTPSETFRTLCENLGSVLQSGQNLPTFLHEQYERYREEAEERQDEVIDQLATAAEIYVTVAVAGMLFLITVLLVIGLTTADTLGLIRIATYVLLPLVNLAFIAYLADLTGPLIAGSETLGNGADGPETDPATSTRETLRPLAADGGVALARLNRNRLRAYRRLATARTLIRRPLAKLLDRPVRAFYVTVPLALAALGYWLGRRVLAGEPLVVTTVDGPVTAALVFVLGSFAVVYEIHQRRLRRMEDALPDLLDRLASLNEAGLTIVRSFDRVRMTDLEGMNEELERIWTDIQWGATVATALERFEERARTPAVTRLVTLLNNSMHAADDIGPVLRIAADEARAHRRFERARRQEMATYLVAIYIAFLVFIVVIVSVDSFFIPRLLEASSGLDAATTSDQGVSEQFVTISRESVADYRVAFFHAALIQAALSGLVAGQMGDGTLKAGAKHAAAMLTVTYAVFELVRLVI